MVEKTNILNTNQLKWVMGAGYLCLFILSLYYYLERTIFVDIAYHTFHILKDGKLAIQNYRIASFFTQLFPLISGKLGLDLNTIIKLYSVAFILLYAISWWICVRLNQIKYAIITFLFSTLLVGDTFFWIQSELPQASMFLLLFFAVYDYLKGRKKNFFQYLILFALLTTGLFSHPLLIIPMVLIVSFQYLFKIYSWKEVIQIGITTIFIITFKKLFFSAAYEENAMNGLLNFTYFFPNYHHIHTVREFIQQLFTDYLLFTTLSIITCVLLIVRKEWLALIALVGGLIGYSLIVTVSFPNPTPQFYMENMYLPLTLILAIPLYQVFLDKLSVKQLGISLAFIFIVTLVRIELTSKLYERRVSWLDQSIKRHLGERLIFLESELPLDTSIMNWGIPYESWLYSTIFTDSTTILVPNPEPYSLNWVNDSPENQVLTNWGAYPENCFRAQDLKNFSRKPYQVGAF